MTCLSYPEQCSTKARASWVFSPMPPGLWVYKAWLLGRVTVPVPAWVPDIVPFNPVWQFSSGLRLFPHPCVDQCSTVSLRRKSCRSLAVFPLCSSLLSGTLPCRLSPSWVCPADSLHLDLAMTPIVIIIMSFPQLAGEIFTFNWFVSHLWGITVFCCLVSSVLKNTALYMLFGFMFFWLFQVRGLGEIWSLLLYLGHFALILHGRVNPIPVGPSWLETDVQFLIVV